MAETYQVLIPDISAASFSINPVSINGKTVLSVTVIERTITVEPDFYYSGDIYSGEV
jgi:hypothetical protein